MATLEDFVPDVSLDCMGVPLPVMEHAIRLAAIEFCDISRAWKETGSINVKASRASYEVPVPDGANLMVIEKVYYNGVRIDPCAPDALDDRYQNWTVMTGDPEVFTQLSPANLTLVPCPVTDLLKGLKFRACYQPDRTATEVPDWLFQQYATAIAKGAVAILASKKGLPCYDEGLSAARRDEFLLTANTAKHKADKGFTRAPRRVKGHFQ